MSALEKPSLIRVHDDPDLFRAAVNFTAAETMFAPRFIEKDFFCTLLLHELAATDRTLVFKGGTCLAKVHAEFYRLSEDIDFVIPTPVDASRTKRRTQAAGIKDAMARLIARQGAFRVVAPFTGANNSTQYIAIIGYMSLLVRQEEIIKIEVGLHEPLLTPVFSGAARTILLDPISGQPMVPIIKLT